MVATAQVTALACVASLVARLTAEAEQEGGYTSLAKAAKPLGATAPSTVFRYATKGVKLADGRRCVLETIRSGKRLLTTHAAIKRFLEAQQGSPAESPPIPRSPAARRRASESASTRADALLA